MPQMREWLAPDGADAPEPDRIVALESPGRVFLSAVSRVLRGRDCADLDHQPVPSWSVVSGVPGRRSPAGPGVSAGQAAMLDAERVARWMISHYPRRRYPGAVFGSPNGSVVHLAAALGMPWLPAAFDVGVRWPAGSVDDPVGALRHGSSVAARILAVNPGVSIRQVHDPAARGALAGSGILLTVRWVRLPDAYRWFLDRCLDDAAPVLLVSDARTWPVLHPGQDGYGFQTGGVAGGFEPADFQPGSEQLTRLLRGLGGQPGRWVTPTGRSLPGYAEHGTDPGFEAGLRAATRAAGGPLHRILAPRPDVLSAAVADLYRNWLRTAGKTGDRCVVECGRLIDPWQVMRAGLVPYWCENASVRSVTAAEWWLAGSAPFSSVDVLPEPPGLRCPAAAGLPQWLAVASFGRQRRAVDRRAARCYPVTPVPTRHATEVLRNQPCDLPFPEPLRVEQVLAELAAAATDAGPLIC